jgi:hypothetical protein
LVFAARGHRLGLSISLFSVVCVVYFVKIVVG